MNTNVKYFLLYSVFSVGLLAYSTISSLKSSINFTTFLLEFTDGFNLGIFFNFMVIIFITTNKLLQLLIFGELRIIEVEHLVESLPVFAINLFFNLATSDNNMILNSFLLGLSISFKVFHIILTDRLDLMNMKIVNNMTEDTTKSQVLYKYLLSFYFWLNLILIGFDFSVAKFLVYDVFQGINSVTCLLFGFQFAVQGVDSMTYFSKMLLNVYELVEYRSEGTSERDVEDANVNAEVDAEVNAEVDAEVNAEVDAEVNAEVDANLDANLDANPDANLDADLLDDDDEEKVWENKAFYSKGIDISSSTLKALSHLCFIYLLMFHSGLSLPISILQGTYSSIRQTYVEVSELLAFIESSKMLDKKLPNATKDDLAESDNLCIICREDMFSVEDYMEQFKKRLSPRRCPKKLVCGHILHMGCLKEWMERSESCPLCRRKVLDAAPVGDASTEQHLAAHAAAQAPPQPNVQAHLQERLREFTDMIHRNPLPEARPVAEPTNGLANGLANEAPPLTTSPPIQTTTTPNPTPTSTNITGITPSSTTSNPTPTSTSLSSRASPVPSTFRPVDADETHSRDQNVVDASTRNFGGYQEISLPNTALLPPDWTVIPLSVIPLDERNDGNEREYKIHYSMAAEGRLTIKKRNIRQATNILRRE